MAKQYDIFISYSRKDYLKEDEKTPDPDKIVSKILAVLDANNISYWIDKEGMYSSAQFAALIEDQISNARCFLFVSTQTSNASKYTLGEVFTAVEYGKSIIPFRADDSKFGKGIGFHLRPLDHIEYFKTGEEAFVKLVDSVKHIKAEQLSNQLVAEYNNIVAEYKTKLRAKSDEMKAIGINPPADSLWSNEDEIKKIRVEYEAELAKLQEKEREIALLRKELTDTKSSLEKLKNELLSYKDAETERKIREAEAIREPEEKNLRGTFKVGNVEFKMIHVEGGTFTMGATPEIKDPFSDERPPHYVTLSSYYIGETPVTQALWRAVMGTNPSYFKGDQLPVDSVSWDVCQEFIEKLSQMTGRNFRLPTEAEWEFAARGGNKSKHYQFSGSNNIAEVAWYSVNSCGAPQPVKKKKANELGIYDMSGNVWEWCNDWKGSYSIYAPVNPTGPNIGAYRVFRGGSWDYSSRYCRTSCRNYNAPDFSRSYNGLRLALSK